MKVVKNVNALKARKNLGELLEGVYYKGAQYVIERAGRYDGDEASDLEL